MYIYINLSSYNHRAGPCLLNEEVRVVCVCAERDGHAVDATLQKQKQCPLRATPVKKTAS